MQREDLTIPIGMTAAIGRLGSPIVHKVWLGDRWADLTPETSNEALRLLSAHPAAVHALTDDEEAQAKAELDALPSAPKEPEPKPPILHEDITLDGWRERIKRMSRPVI